MKIKALCLAFLLPVLALASPPASICDPSTSTTCATIKAANASATSGDAALVTIIALPGGNPCLNPSATLVTVSGATAGTAATQVIAATAGKIYICSMAVVGVSGTTPTFSLVTGTGTNCGTGQAVLLPGFATAAGALYAFTNPVAVGPAAGALCYLDTGTTPVQNYVITYVQQ